MDDGTLFLVILGVVALVAYLIACLVWPWGSCGRCKGRGKLRSPTRRYHRDCPSCGGKGRKLRAGRAVYAVARRSR